MKRLSSLVAAAALFGPHAAQAFAPSTGVRCCRGCTHLAAAASDINSSSRRNFLSSTLATASAASALVLAPLPGAADVSDGNALPQGAAQFSRVLKVRAQLQSVAKRVTEQTDEVDKKE